MKLTVSIDGSATWTENSYHQIEVLDLEYCDTLVGRLLQQLYFAISA